VVNSTTYIQDVLAILKKAKQIAWHTRPKVTWKFWVILHQRRQTWPPWRR